MTKLALHIFAEVADLVQQGELDRAQALAVTISVDYLKGRALLLVNDSRRL